jgi:hypothetical protein
VQSKTGVAKFVIYTNLKMLGKRLASRMADIRDKKPLRAT